MLIVKLFDSILGPQDRSFCRGRAPRFFQYGNSEVKYLYSHERMIGSISTPSERNYGLAVESKAIFPYLYNFLSDEIPYLKKRFVHIYTFSKELIALDPDLFKWCPASGIYIGTPYGGGEIGLSQKNKLISMVASSKTWVKGHKLRVKLAQTLFQNNMADVFGESVGRPIQHINDGLAPYMFSFVVENDCSVGYFTEKLCNALAVGTIPIFHGADVSEFFNMDGILPLDLTKSPKQIVSELTTELYQSKIEAVKDNLERCQKYLCPEDFIYESYWK